MGKMTWQLTNMFSPIWEIEPRQAINNESISVQVEHDLSWRLWLAIWDLRLRLVHPGDPPGYALTFTQNRACWTRRVVSRLT